MHIIELETTIPAIASPLPVTSFFPIKTLKRNSPHFNTINKDSNIQGNIVTQNPN